MKAIKTKWFPPYVLKNNKLKPNLKIASKQFNSGVYIVKDAKTNKILYVGYSGTQLYKTIYRHFQVWTSKQYRVRFNKSGYKVKVIFCSPIKAQQLEKHLIQQYKTLLNKNQYEAEFTEAKDTGEVAKFYGLNDIKTLNPGEEYPF